MIAKRNSPFVSSQVSIHSTPLITSIDNKPEGDLTTEDGHLDFFLMTYKNVFTEAPETQSRFLQVLYENIVCPIKPPSLPLYSDLITKVY